MKLADVKMSLKDKKTERRIIVCSVLIAVIIALAVLMFFIGKSFEIHLSNMPYSENGIVLKGIDDIEVQFDKQKPFTSYAMFSDTVQGVGLKHTLRVNHNGKDYVKTFKIPVSYSKVVINLPKFINSTDDVSLWMTKLETQTSNEDALSDDTPGADEFSIE